MSFASLFAVPAPARASTWAALDEVPVQTGELRLAEPIEGAVGFPVKEIDFDARVDGPIATVTVEQVFDNPYDRPIEAVYVFPMPDGAAVHAYRIQVGERTIEGEIREAEAARRAYEAAKSAGRAAALVEEQKPNVFTQSVANILPKQAVRVRFTYVEQLAFEDGGHELVFPLVVGPRYLPADTTDPAPVSAGRYGASGTKVQIGVRLAAGVPLAEVTSPSHVLSERTLDAATREVSVTGVRPDRDFVLRWRTAGDRTYVGLLTHREQKGGYFSLIVQPKLAYESSEITAREVILLIDRSCSMSGIPIMRAREIAESLVRSLGSRDTFDVISFADSAEAYTGHPVPASDGNKEAASTWIGRLEAGGGTQLLGGVTKALLKAPGERRVRQVVVITDGEVGNDDQILNAVGQHAAHNRIFPVGVGASPNRYLLDRLASGARGFASYVAVDESPALAIDRVVRRTSRPYLTGVEIDWGGLSVAEISPRVLPDVYAGQPLLVSGKFTAPGKQTIHVLGRVAGRPVDVPLEVDLGAGEPHEGVAFVWARRAIDDLMASDYTRTDARTKATITRIALEHAIVTPYTSFLAIDQGRIVGNGSPFVVTQTLDTPANRAGTMVAMAPPDPAPDPSPTVSEPPRRYSGGGGGGDLDPITILTMIGALPLAWRLRRRRG